MRDKKQYNTMVDITYTLVCSAYLSMSIIGYLMFGQSTLQQVMSPPFPPTKNQKPLSVPSMREI